MVGKTAGKFSNDWNALKMRAADGKMRKTDCADTDALGMLEMQARAFAARDAQHLLIKAPLASGKPYRGNL